MALAEKPGETTVRFRVPDPIHGQLKQAAKSRGVSLTSEIVYRLEQSFAIDRVIGGSVIDDRQLLAVLKMVAMAMSDAGRFSGFAVAHNPADVEAWKDVPYAYNEAFKAAIEILQEFRPPGAIAPPKPIAGMTDPNDIGPGLARGLLEAVARGAARTLGDVGKVQLIVEELGPLHGRIKSHAVGSQSSAREAWGKKKAPKRSKP